jgi:Protein kinase domain
MVGETRRAGELPPLPQAKDDPLIGQTVGDRYKIVEQIGIGGMASVYRAEHLLLHKPVAIKLLHADFDADPQIGPRFEREAIAAARLDHPNCVSISDFGKTASGRMYLTMEYLEGVSLAHLERPLLWPRAVELTRQILRGLSHAHETGIVHRDLKPSNVMVARHGEREVAKIIDFGIAKMVEGNDLSPRVETQAGIVFGTADFIAPERLLGKDGTDTRSDLYAVGVILYELLTGIRPFHDDDAYTTVKRALSEAARPPSAFVSGIPVALDVAVLRALEKNPDARYQTAQEFLKTLDPFVKQATAPALTRARTGRRVPWSWVATAVAAVGVLVIAIVLGGSSRSGVATPAAATAEPSDEVARLIHQAGEGDSPAERQSAFDRLVALGFSDRVPWVPMLSRDLATLPTCEARREVVAKIRKVKNPSSLPALEKAMGRSDNTCLIEDARAAMADIMGADAPKKRPPPRRSSGGGHF